MFRVSRNANLLKNTYMQKRIQTLTHSCTYLSTWATTTTHGCPPRLLSPSSFGPQPQTMRILYATARWPFCCCCLWHTHAQAGPLFRIEPQTLERSSEPAVLAARPGPAPLPGVFICASNLRIIAALITFTPLYDKRKQQVQQQQQQ